MIPVYLKESRGSAISVIDNKRLYGPLMNRAPTEVSFECYTANRKHIIQAPYTKSWLENKFPGEIFPDIIFTYSEVKYLPRLILMELANGMKVKHKFRNKTKSLVRNIRLVLRELP